MKITLQKIKNSVPLLNILISRDLKVKVAYTVRKNTKIINDEVKIIQESEQALFEKYGIQNGDKMEMDLTTENGKKGQEEVLKLLEKEVDIDIKPIKIEELGDIKITTGELIYLDFMLVD